MNQARTLRLRAESLGELTTAELTRVAAGAPAPPTVPVNTCVFCFTQPTDCICVSQDATQCC